MFYRFAAALLAASILVGVGDAHAQSATPLVLTPERAVQSAQQLSLAVNKSMVLRVNQTVSRIAVGNPEIVDAVALTDRSFYVLGKSLGSSNLSVYGERSQLLAVVDVVVGTDIEGVKAAIKELMPDETVEVRSVNNSISLSGTLSNPSRVAQAIEIARKFTDKDRVINNMRVRGVQQVMLQVKVAEMQRSLSQALGFKPFIGPQNGNLRSTGFSFSTLDPVDVTRFALIAGQAISGSFTFQVTLDALEQKGAVKLLAEPNLVVTSGDTANFLAGGEFPVPVAQTVLTGSAPTTTVEFKPFGVSLAFTPTVLDGDLINLAIAPEVSQIDRTNAVVSNGLVIPGISTRRAKTTVELRDGQSFAVAGLLQNNFTDQIRGVPGLMDVPILGALFRSSEYQRNESELVIIITPKLVQPVPSRALIAPTDSFVPPSDADFFFRGQTEGGAPQMPIGETGGGLVGRYGHIIR